MTNYKKALLIVDIQNDFVSGSLATDPQREYVKKTSVWLKRASDNYHYLVTTQDWHIDPEDHFEKWPVHCEADTEGADLSEHILLALEGTEYHRLLKGQYSHGYSGFDGVMAEDNKTYLQDWLRDRDVDTVDIIGIATDHCVYATAVDSVAFGFKTTVLKDYVNGVSKPTSHKLLHEGGFEKIGAKVQ